MQLYEDTRNPLNEFEIRLRSTHRGTTLDYQTNDAGGDLLYTYLLMFGLRWKYIGYVTALGLYQINKTSPSGSALWLGFIYLHDIALVPWSLLPRLFRVLNVHIYLIYVRGFEKRGHFAPDVNFETLIYSEIIGNQLSFAACFMFIASWIHFYCAFI